MPPSSPRILPEDRAVDVIVNTVMSAPAGSAPFALVLGSGFSHGLVPTAREIVNESLPLWIRSLEEGRDYQELTERPKAERQQIAREFWKDFVGKNSPDLDLELDEVTGLPKDHPAAYKAAFDPSFFGAVGGPADARRFQRKLMRLDEGRLNTAHFLLGSLLGVQPGRTRANDAFRAKAAFTRLILTTNFDPFLQTALQAVNRLYFMSDTPELGVGDEILDDQIDAIHLVYVHGSVHRRSQAATEADIQRLKARNARALEPVLKRRGVIVLGYSGWDDVIVEALADCVDFDHRLYWMGLESDPMQKGAFGPRVAEILRKPTANYVQIAGAGSFMAQLAGRLIGVPRLLGNPIAQVREMLETIDLADLEDGGFRDTSQGSGSGTAPGSRQERASTIGGRPGPEAFVEAQKDAIKRLELAERVFDDPGRAPTVVEREPEREKREEGTEPEETEDAPVQEATPSSSAARQRLQSAQIVQLLGNHEETIKITTEGLAIEELAADDRARLLLMRASAHHALESMDEAVADLSAVVDGAGAPVEGVAIALYNRGVLWGQLGDSEKEIADYTRLIELPDAPEEQVGRALYNRAVTWGQLGDSEKEIADYSRLIDLAGTPPHYVAQALYNRAVTWGQQGDVEKEMADYDRLIELPDAPVEQVAPALYNRAVTWGQLGEVENELADYTRLIELPDAPVVQVAQALYNRGVTWGQQGEPEKEIEDYTRLIELHGAPVEQIAKALYNRGVTWGQRGEWEKAIEDYEHVIERLPGAPPDQVAKALFNRAVTRKQRDDTAGALADLDRIIELPGAPPDQVAKALYNRAVSKGQDGDTEGEIADYGRVIELPGAPPESVAQALYNRALTWEGVGDSDKEMADYDQLIELPGAPAEEVGKALYNRALTWGQRGDPQKEIADYTRLIEMPDAPVEQLAQALYNRGVTLARMGEIDLAVGDYSRVADEMPDAPLEVVAKALNYRALTRLTQGDLDSAAADSTRVIEELPEAPVGHVALALNNRAIAFVTRDEPEKAIADLDRVIALPEAPPQQISMAFKTRGWIRYGEGQYPAFLADTESALEADPTASTAAFNLGLALLANDRDADALAAYQEAAKRFPEEVADRAGEVEAARESWLAAERAQPILQALNGAGPA